MGHEDDGAIEANGTPLRFKGLHEFLCQHADSGKVALIQRIERSCVEQEVQEPQSDRAITTA